MCFQPPALLCPQSAGFQRHGNAAASSMYVVVKCTLLPCALGAALRFHPLIEMGPVVTPHFERQIPCENGIFDWGETNHRANQARGLGFGRLRCARIIGATTLSGTIHPPRSQAAPSASQSSDRRTSNRAPGIKGLYNQSALRGAATSAHENKLLPHRRSRLTALLLTKQTRGAGARCAMNRHSN